MSTKEETLVLGAGLAGLACAWKLTRAGLPVTVLEEKPYLGGFAASFTHERVPGEIYTYDFGPHRFHTADPALHAHIEALLAENKRLARRLSRIVLFGKFFDYPLKTGNVLKALPPHLLIKAFLDYFWIKFLVRTGLKRIPDDNFEDWVIKRFGKTLYRIFFGTYTEKAWKMSCRDISADWAAQRISQLSLWDTVKKTLFPGKGQTARSLVTEFLYPEHGGIGEIARAYAREIEAAGGRVLTASSVLALRREGNRALGVEVGGDQARFLPADRILSTIPITTLIRLLEPGAPPEVRQASSSLQYSAIVFVFLMLDRSSVSPDSWVYLPERHLTIHRIAEFRNFSPHCAPPGKTMLSAEITCRRGDDIWNMDLESATRVAVKDLVAVGLIHEKEVLGSFIHKLSHAYPVYDLHYKDNLAPVRAFLAGFSNLETGGRQGLFRYNNMDQSVEMGLKMAEAVLGGEGGHESVATGKEYFG